MAGDCATLRGGRKQFGPASGTEERGNAPATALRIGDVARRTGLTPRTIRYYEEEGLLPSPARGRPRTYTERHVRALELVRGLKVIGSSLAEIRRYLRAFEAAREGRSGPSRQIGELRRRIESRIAELEALARALPAGSSSASEA